MNRLKRKNRVMSVVLIFALVFTMFSPAAFAAVGDKWTGTSEGDILIKDTITKITDGVYEHEVITNNAQGNDQKIDYLCEIAPSDKVKIVAGYGKDSAASWSLTPTTVQAAAYEKNHKGETVVAGINADFFNMATGEPMGALVMEGTEYHASNGGYYFGITKDGKPVIRNSSDLSDLEAAVGGDALLIDNGNVITENTAYGALDYSRTAIGIKEDGTVVTFVTYGNRAPISCGRTYMEIAQMLQKSGCVYALALDGGGSATYAGRPEGTDKLEVRNSPNDGAERAVSSTILIVSTAEKTGEFSHAQLYPNNEVYTPGSKVEFTANGVDTAGFAMDIPQGTTWALDEASAGLGTIDKETGVFTAGSETGTVTVNLIKDAEVIGKTTIEIVVPDHIYFASEEVSLGFEEESDLGIVVRSKGRDINYKDGDFIWKIEDSAAGAFNGNIFKSSDGNSVTTKVTVASVHAEDVTGSITVIVGKLPTIVWDFEDKVDENGNVILADNYYTGEDGSVGILTHSNYGRGGNESIEIVSIDDDEPVFFGEKSLKLNYDFTQCGAVTEGACIGTTEGMTVPGTPTGIGVWVYAPEGVGIEWKGDGTQSGFWLRGYVKDGNGSNQPYDFTLEPKNVKVQNGEEQPGIYWEGWKYLEADLTNIASPYGIQPGMTFRLMYVAGTGMGTKTANSIYFDNLQFVYGTNVDDVDAPVVNSITINGEELKDGQVIKSGTINVDSIISDVQNKYTTGIDHSTVRMYIDGINVVGNDKYQYAYDSSGQMLHLYNAKLGDGLHSVTVLMKDGFGNETSVTKYFIVDTNTKAPTSVEIVSTDALLGGAVKLQIKASDATVEKSVTSFRLGNQFKDYEVVFSDNYKGDVSYSNLSKNITITAERKQDASAEDDNVIATLSVKIPSSLLKTDYFTYTVKAGSYLTSSNYYNTYSTKENKIPVVAGYNLNAKPIIVGGENGVIQVTDANGNKAPAGVKVYLAADNSEVGATDANGEIVTDKFNAAAGEYAVYAKDDEGALSFQYKIVSYDPRGAEDGTPEAVRFNAVQYADTMQSITWLTNPLNEGKQEFKYAVKGSDDWKSAEVTTKQYQFASGGFDVSNINGTIITGLTPDTTYEYKVGTGEAVVTGTFTTDKVERTTGNFFIIPDIQDPNKTDLTTIVNNLNKKDWDMGIQIGDAIDQANDYDDWAELGKVLGAKMLGDTPILSVMGNHEYYGDAKAEISGAMYNNPVTEEGTYYSFENGNVYIAVINFATTKAQIEKAAAWLVEDAAKSDATWKILCTHQPVYYTNSAGGNEIVYEILPDAAEKAGIDVVFSGHDHAIGRTNMLTDDEVDTDNGVVYYVTGAAGAKRYSVASQNIFDYNKIFGFTPTADFKASYLTVSSDKDKMVINMYDIGKGDGENGLLDTFTIYSECYKNGHTNVYDPATGNLECSVCHELVKDFTGEVFDAKDNEYYLLGGKAQTGWVTVGEEIRYYDAKGVREEVTKDETPSTCIIDGHCIHTSKSGAEYVEEYNDAGGHEYVEKDGKYICSECGWQRVEMKDLKVSLNYYVTTYTGKAKTPTTTAINPVTGETLKKNNPYRDYYSVYSNNTEVGEAKVVLNAARYGYYVDMTDWRGNYKDSVTITYEIRPDAPKTIKATTSGSKVKLSWTAANAKDVNYIVYKATDGKTWKKVATTTGLSYTVSKSDFIKASYKVGTSKAVNGKAYDSIEFTGTVGKLPAITASNDAEGKPTLDWEKVENAKSYAVYRATSKTGKYSKVFTTTGTSYTHTSATIGKSYYYKVKVTFKDGTSQYTDIVKKTCTDPYAIEAKKGNNSSGKPTVKWNTVPKAEYYQVYISKSKTFKSSKIVKVTGTSYTHSTAAADRTYYYKVKVKLENGESRTSKVLTNSVKAANVKITVTKGNNSSGKPTLKWTKVSNVKHYQVYISKSSTFKSTKVIKTTKTSYTHKTAAKGRTYYYKVKVTLKNGQTKTSTVTKNACK